LADAPDYAADRLAACGFRIDNPAGVIGANETIQAYKPEVGVNAYFGKDRRKAEDCLWTVRLLNWFVVSMPSKAGELVSGEQFGIGDVQIRIRQRERNDF